MLISALLNCYVPNIKLANMFNNTAYSILLLNIITSKISGYTIVIASNYTLCKHSYSYSYDVKNAHYNQRCS